MPKLTLFNCIYYNLTVKSVLALDWAHVIVLEDHSSLLIKDLKNVE